MPARRSSKSHGGLGSTCRFVSGLRPPQSHSAADEHEGNTAYRAPDANCDDLQVGTQVVGNCEKCSLGPGWRMFVGGKENN